MKRAVLAVIVLVFCMGAAFAQTANDYFKEGNRYYDQEDWDRAITAYTQAIRLAPKESNIYVNRGLCYFNKGDYDKAIADADAALRIAPNEEIAKKIKGCKNWQNYIMSGETVNMAVGQKRMEAATNPFYKDFDLVLRKANGDVARVVKIKDISWIPDDEIITEGKTAIKAKDRALATLDDEIRNDWIRTRLAMAGRNYKTAPLSAEDSRIREIAKKVRDAGTIQPMKNGYLQPRRFPIN